MNCVCALKIRRWTGDRLRRARRLYARFVFESCVGDKRMTAICAARAQARGLWAASTSIRNVYFSLCTHLCRLDRETNPTVYWRGRSHTWHDWMRRFEMWPIGHGEISGLLNSRLRTPNTQTTAAAGKP